MLNQPLTSEEFKDIYSKVPRLCVDVIIKTEDGVLLTLRNEDSWKDMWHIPGGTVYYKESLEDAVRRVAREELGIEVEVIKNIGYIEYPDEEKERGFGYTVSVEFLCKPQSLEFNLNDQATEVKFFKSLPENIIEEHKKFIDKNLNLQ